MVFGCAVIGFACDSGEPEGADPHAQAMGSAFALNTLLGDGFEGESLRDGFVLPELPDAGTQPWEPANGYFERNFDDPKDQVFYDDCPAGPADGPLEFVDEIEVTPADQSLTWYNVLTFIPEGVTVLDGQGEVRELGDREALESCEYSSSHAHCERSGVQFDFAALPFLPGIDARLVGSSELHMFWDYGQQGFYVIRKGSSACEGADCGHPFVANFPATPPPEGCESMGGQVYQRLTSP